MCIRKIVTVPVLTDPEAWHLFKEKMGNCLENEDLHDIAKKIARECGGLPIAIVTLATALAHTEVYEWKEALQQLKKGSVTSIPEMGEKVYSSIRLSYDFLGIQLPQAQRILLLCSQWPEDSHIEVETLVRCTFGLRLFEDVHTMDGARNKIDTLVKRLTSCYLLQAVTDKTVKVHDVVQDVCTSILRNETPSNVGSTWSSDTLDYSNYKLIQIEPNGSSNSIDFEGMGEIRILEFAPQNGNQLTCVCKIPSFQFLTNIRVLCLEYNIFSGDLSSLGYLKGLEVLSFLESFLLEELPSNQICQLNRLKVLDLRCNRGLGSCILSGLNKLEELYIGEQHSWQCSSSSGNEEESECASIAELNSLSSLTALKTRLSDTMNFKDLRVNLFDKLETFHITIKNERGSSYGPSRLHGKRLSLWKVNLSLLSDVKLLSLHRNTEHLCVEEMDLKNHFLKEFGKLKSLKIACCDKAEFLFDAADIAFATKMESLEVGKMNDLIEICRDGKLQAGSLVKLQKADLWSLPALRHLWRFPVRLPSLGNLRVLRLYDCHALRSLFSYSVAQCLVQLESISINWCCMLEEIISNDGGEVIITKHRSKDNSNGTIPPLVNRQVIEEVIEIKVNDSSQTESMDTILEFPKLRVIKLDSLNMLTSFCPSDHKLLLPLLENVSIKKCPNMNFFCRGQVSAPNVKNVKVDGGPVSIGDLNTI